MTTVFSAVGHFLFIFQRIRIDLCPCRSRTAGRISEEASFDDLALEGVGVSIFGQSRSLAFYSGCIGTLALISAISVGGKMENLELVDQATRER